MQLLDDRPPAAKLSATGIGELVTPQAVVPLSVELADDYGLAAGELVAVIDGDATSEQLRPFEDLKAGQTHYAAQIELPLAQLHVQAGQQLSLLARGRDLDDVRGPNVGLSSPVSLQVVTEQQLLAELARREQQIRHSFEQLIDDQEQLRRDLLTSFADLTAADLPGRLSQAERQQRQIASSATAVTQQFQQVYQELQLNRLDNEITRQRLEYGIIAPLSELTAQRLPEAADQISRLAEQPSTEQAAAVDSGQAELLAAMRAVLANMIKWEGLEDMVVALRDLVRLQEQLRQQTRQIIEQQGSSLFLEPGDQPGDQR